MFGRHPTRWLAPYAEGLLPAAHASQIAGHVLCCPRCRRTLDLVRTGQALFATLPPARDAAPSWSELAPLLDAPARPVPAFRWAFAAAVAVLVAAGGLVWRGFGSVEARAWAPLEALALDAHRDGTRELRTGDAQLAESWLAERAGLEVSAPPSTGQRHLEGAARLAGGAVALAYRLGEEPVTLVVGGGGGGGARPPRPPPPPPPRALSSWTPGHRS
jgi:hypothetical protein